MTGGTNLQVLLQNIQPELREGKFVFRTMDPATASDLHVAPIGQFLEVEGNYLSPKIPKPKPSPCRERYQAVLFPHEIEFSTFDAERSGGFRLVTVLAL